MDYAPTAAEMTIVRFLIHQPKFAAKRTELEALFPEQKTALYAVEGCLAKKFMREDFVLNKLVLTPLGKRLV